MESLFQPAVTNGSSAIISEQQRLDLQARLTENFQSLLFHREGYHTIQFSQQVAEHIAKQLENKAFTSTSQAYEEGKEPAEVLRQYAQEAATLLLAEVDKFSVPLHGSIGRITSSSGAGGLDASSMSLNEFSGGLRSIQTAPMQQQLGGMRHKETVWGWLVPGSRMLPYIGLKGNGVAIGRGKEALWAVAGGTSSPSSPRTCLAHGNNKDMQEVLKRNLGFAEVPDGRVSRLHCMITVQWPDPSAAPVVLLEDCSSNGTFLNGKKLNKGESVAVSDGDRISLVLSVAPLTELFFVVRKGDVRDGDVASETGEAWLDSAHSAGTYTPTGTKSPNVASASTSSIWRTATSRYTTADQSTLDDLKCQICLNTLRNCVALEPCGHNFCACCLSHHMASQLQSGMQLTCPFRCLPPERIIINYAVRGLIDLLGAGRPFGPDRTTSNLARGTSSAAAFARVGSSASAGTSAGAGGNADAGVSSGGAAASSSHGNAIGSPSHRASAGGVGDRGMSVGGGRPGSSGGHRRGTGDGPLAIGITSGASLASSTALPTLASMMRTESLDGDFYTQSMSMLCPLDDAHLPMDAVNLKGKQVEVSLVQLKDTAAGADAHQVCLESLARLAWSDDDVREGIASGGGIRAVVDVMALHADNDGIQCNSCLALMSLVRGEGEVCQSNQWHIAKAGALEAVTAAMQRFRDVAMVQLSVLLCCIPLALENAMMQAHITQLALHDIILALDNHPDEVDIQTKGLVLLGVLIQGEDATHDAIRQRELEQGVPARVVRALTRFGEDSDDVLWAALFVLAVLVREQSSMYTMATQHVARAGLLDVLKRSVAAYKARYDEQQQEPDEMVVTAGDYLIRVLEPVVAQAAQVRQLLRLAGIGAAATGAALLYMQWRGTGRSGSKQPDSMPAPAVSRGGSSVLKALAATMTQTARAAAAGSKLPRP